MKRLLTVVLAAALSAADAVDSASGECGAACRDSGTSFMRDAIQKYVDSRELPGAVSIIYDGGSQETACIGYADLHKKRPVTLDSHFMQCSQTKGFCGVTVAMLIEEGKVQLDDPVSKYLPEFKDLTIVKTGKCGVRTIVKAKNVLTVRHVMNHTGGFPFELPNFRRMGGWSHRMPLRSVAAIAAALPLDFEPGTKVQYSNVGIDIGAAVVEKVSGMRWEDFLKVRVLDPLGMKQTTFWPNDTQLAGMIEMYRLRGGTRAKWQSHGPSMQRPYNGNRVFASAGAGLWTTARDQLKFYKMLMNLGVGDNGVRILKEKTVRELLAKSTRPDGMKGYSLGLNTYGDGWFGHGGAWSTQCRVNPDKRRLWLWVVQALGGGGARPWNAARDKAVTRFFKAVSGKRNGESGERP